MTGGDPACWLGEVCEDCGQLREDPSRERCVRCGHRLGEDVPAPRDRDAAGRARNARPRDGLGRPLPYGEAGVERTQEGVRRTPAETLEQAQQLLDVGMPFHAHEVLEDAWKTAAESERALWRGLAQLAVGLTHAMRGNAAGARALGARGAESLRRYEDRAPYGVDIAGLRRWSQRHLEGSGNATAGVPTAPAAPRLTL